MGSSTSIPSLDRSNIPSGEVRFINYDLLKNFGAFPRYPENHGHATKLSEIRRDQTLMIFISHCWLRGHVNSEGFDGYPHPDNVNGDIYKLCISGIDRIRRDLAPDMKQCYVWIDYSCIDQDCFPQSEIRQLHRIMEVCDIVFTPIASGSRDWSISPSLHYLNVYQSKAWKDGDTAYLNRTWCRVEMFYAANIPTLGNTNSKKPRHALMKGVLAQHCENGRRPHLVFGRREHYLKILPVIFPPLLSSFYETYDPLQGTLGKDTDRQYIEMLMNQLVPYMDKNKTVVGYRGDTNEFGQKHGHGSQIYPNGDVYDGQYSGNKRHGLGTLSCLNLEAYTGGFKDGVRHGQGVMHYSDGSLYDGEWVNDRLQGRGTFWFVNGDQYKGDFVDGSMHGKGVYQFVNGDVYTGDFEKHLKCGMGRLMLKDGKVEYEGVWMNDKRCG